MHYAKTFHRYCYYFVHIMQKASRVAISIGAGALEAATSVRGTSRTSEIGASAEIWRTRPEYTKAEL